jgi:Holliday junction DNA helicase RuvA
MIGSVRGTVIERSTLGEVLMEVGGVGYRVLVPTGAFDQLVPGSPAFLFTHLHVREDAMTLYGFPTRDERDVFEVLLGANGVGPKLGLAILSVHTPGALRLALVDEDLEALTMVSGVGKRTAQRLLVDLQSKLDVPDFDLSVGAGGGTGNATRPDVREALVGLGYDGDEIRAVLAQLPVEGTVESLLREALKLLAGARS